MRRFLFDRLCNPELHMPEDNFGKVGVLRKSIKEELQRLFSGRSWFDGIQKGHAGDKSILNFGIDNPVDYDANAQDNVLLMDQVLEMIKNYEPRLLNPQVELRDNNNQKGNINRLSPKSIAISGQIKIADVREDFSHSLSISGAE